MKILLLAANRLPEDKSKWKGNWGHELFRRELARQNDVIFFGPNYSAYNKKLTVFDLFKEYGPFDFILTHYNELAHDIAKGLEKATIPKVHIAGGDYCRKAPRYHAFFKRFKPDIIFAPVEETVIEMSKNRVVGKHFWLPYAVDTTKYYDYKVPREIDVMASFGMGGQPSRTIIKKFLGRSEWKRYTKRVYFEDYIRKINESKMFVTCNIEYKHFGGKYTEVMACNTLMMANKPDDFNKLGYKNFEHMVLYKDDFSKSGEPKDLKDKIDYFLKHEDERIRIAKTGMEFVHKHHSLKVRVKEFSDIVRKEL